jgi:hypothetical protein
MSGSVQKVLLGRKSRNLAQTGSVYLAIITTGAVRSLPFPSLSHSSLSVAGSLLPVFGGDGINFSKDSLKVWASFLLFFLYDIKSKFFLW